MPGVSTQCRARTARSRRADLALGPAGPMRLHPLAALAPMAPPRRRPALTPAACLAAADPMKGPRTAPDAAPAAAPAPTPIAAPSPVQAPANGNGSGFPGTFSWANMDGGWCVRGGKDQQGKRVTVTRKNGSMSQVTLGRVVRKLGEWWFYEVV